MSLPIDAPSVCVLIRARDRKRATNILTAHNVRHTICKGYYRWQAYPFNVPPDQSGLLAWLAITPAEAERLERDVKA